MDLRGAIALVTGGNGGLGQRICHALAKEGVHIAVMYAQSRDQAEGVARELTSRYQINAAAFACDITDGAAVERLVGDVTKRFGRLDILVNDAAYNKSVPFSDLDYLTLEVWDKIMAVNLTGPMRLTKAVAPVMKAQGRGAASSTSRPWPGSGRRAPPSPMRCRRRASFTSPAAWRWRWRPRRSSTAWRRDFWKAREPQPICGPSLSSAPRRPRS
jgi:NAD(P)-dependent dehydrogenase (short-subunit alcohol dehydrogenase family)